MKLYQAIEKGGLGAIVRIVRHEEGCDGIDSELLVGDVNVLGGFCDETPHPCMHCEAEVIGHVKIEVEREVE